MIIGCGLIVGWLFGFVFMCKGVDVMVILMYLCMVDLVVEVW